MNLSRVDVFLCRAEIKLLIFALPALVASLAGKLIFEWLANDFPGLNQLLLDNLSAAEMGLQPAYLFLVEGKARLYWMASVLAYIFVNIGFLIFLWKLFRQASSRERFYILGYLVVLALLDVAYFSSINEQQSPISYIFYFTFDVLSATAHIGSVQTEIIFYVLNFMNVLAVFIVPTGILVGCTLVNTQNETLTVTRRRLHTLNELMQIASIVMIVGLIHMQLWLSWPLYMVSGFEEMNQLKALLMAIIQYWGICYSITMAALYLPIAYHLHTIERKQNGQQTIEDGGVTSPAQLVLSKLPQLTSVLAPMIIGSVSPALSEIFA